MVTTQIEWKPIRYDCRGACLCEFSLSTNGRELGCLLLRWHWDTRRDIHREDQSTRSSGVLTCLCPRVELVTCVVTGMTSNMAAGIGINSLSIELPWRFVLSRRQERRIVADDECGGGRPTTCAAAPQLRGGPYHAANKSVTRHFWPWVLRQIE